jgi:hypothetical protein
MGKVTKNVYLLKKFSLYEKLKILVYVAHFH